MYAPRNTLITAAAAGTSVLALITATASATPAAPAHEQTATASSTPANMRDQTSVDLRRWAADTWHSFEGLVDPATGLPADNIEGDLAPSTRSGYTSPTNIGGYLWSTVAARDLGIIGSDEAYRRMRQTLDTMASVSRNEPSGMFYNWYDEHTGKVITTWPTDGHTIIPFLSSVDNGWFAASLRVVAGAEPRLRAKAMRLYNSMNFGSFYDPDARADQNVGLLRGGFYDTDPGGCNVHQAPYTGEGPDVWYTCNHYDITVTEPRLALYLGIANGEIPRKAYFGPNRTFPVGNCNFAFEQKPIGGYHNYLGVDVFEGAYQYRGMKIVPSWGGDMFEALMPDLFVPEATWGPRSWGVNHPLTVRAQIEHGLDEAHYGYWGFSPASDPFGNYREYGVEELGMSPDGYASDEPRTNVDKGYEGCRDATNPNPTFNNGVVTPHASFLALPYAQAAAVKNLRNIEDVLGAYGPGGFYDSVAVGTDTIAKRYLSLDQAMVMGAIVNDLNHDAIKRAFVDKSFERALRPLMAMEVFNAGSTNETQR
ncbi:MAG: glucoamylase family protein [Nocardioidaceae bacterium]